MTPGARVRDVSERLIAYGDHLVTLGLEGDALDVYAVSELIFFDDRREWIAQAASESHCIAVSWAYVVACALYDEVQS